MGMHRGPATEQRDGVVDVVEVRNGVKTVVKSAASSVPGANFDSPFSSTHWRHVSVSRIAGITRVLCGRAVLEVRQPIVGGARRAGMMTNWAPIRFDDVVLGTAAVN